MITPLPMVPTIDAALAAHIVLALFAFGFVLPLGGSLGYCHPRGTKDKTWFYAHASLQLLGGLAGLGCWISTVVHVNNVGSPNFSNSHEILGMAVIVGVLLQLINGICRPHLPKGAGTEPSPQRKAWYGLHRILAFFVLICGATNLLLGPGVLDSYLGGATYFQIAGLEYNRVVVSSM